jgi:hypothetical protein
MNPLILDTKGDFELVQARSGDTGALIIRCRHCGHPEGGGNPTLVRTWWVSMTGDATPIHETCPSRVPATD